MLSGTGLGGQSFAQPRAPVQGFGGTTVRPSVSSPSEVVVLGLKGINDHRGHKLASLL